MNAYEQLLSELGAVIGIPLSPDHNQSCKLELGGLSLQIDLDMNGEDLLIGSHLASLNPSPWRDSIFKQALKDNGAQKLPRGTLAFSQKNNSLVIFQFIPLTNLNGDRLYQHLLLFVEHAIVWSESLKKGEIPSLEEEAASGGPKMFGL